MNELIELLRDVERGYHIPKRFRHMDVNSQEYQQEIAKYIKYLKEQLKRLDGKH